VMRAGKIVTEGPPADFLRGDAEPYVRELVDTPRRQAERVAALSKDAGA
jgi:osmoprotectant transport system ATP-binding protein